METLAGVIEASRSGWEMAANSLHWDAEISTATAAAGAPKPELPQPTSGREAGALAQLNTLSVPSP